MSGSLHLTFIVLLRELQGMSASRGARTKVTFKVTKPPQNIPQFIHSFSSPLPELHPCPTLQMHRIYSKNQPR
ncbi:hypothetical protein BKA65DRAFT_189377 [Rhexocercosporidium sp. MPI-PUGE-AT-0058]|nr:hypothetical protein BKA65DRAFT_189377 [Rhexocercosporidium sp. MPI-PUGE-AT-0058]